MTFREAVTTKHLSNGKNGVMIHLNGKRRSIDFVDILNPFVYRWNIPFYEWVKIAVMTVTVLPLRILIVGFMFMMTCLLATAATARRTPSDLLKPMSGWRKHVALPLFLFFARGVFFFGSLHWIRMKGVRSSRAIAPILVLAPHSSFLDALIVVALGMHSVVGKTETANSVVGCLLKMTQPILVTREDPNSRQRTLNEICDRCQLGNDWPQVVIFPEGTCTNRSCLINFKLGAFVPGVPVQPVVVRWPNQVDTTTWTWEGPAVLKLLWLTMCQFHTYLTIEFLPVYNPTEEEKRNPQLFANNVRRIMANALQVPTTDHSYEDCRLMTLAKKHGLPIADVILEFSTVLKAIQRNYASVGHMLSHLVTSGMSRSVLSRRLDLHEFAEFLQHPVSSSLETVFNFYDKDKVGQIDVRDYMVHLCMLSLPSAVDEAVRLAFKVFDTENSSTGHNGSISVESASRLIRTAFNFTEEEMAVIVESTRLGEQGGRVSLDELLAVVHAVVGTDKDTEAESSIYANYAAEFNRAANKQRQQSSSTNKHRPDKCPTVAIGGPAPSPTQATRDSNSNNVVDGLLSRCLANSGDGPERGHVKVT